MLTNAAIYGPNASGKSNLIKAMGFTRQFAPIDSVKETRSTGAIGVDPFRLSAETTGQPSHFEIVFLAGGKRYRYGFDLNSERVLSEWLYYVPTIREARLFERDMDDVVLSDAFKEGRGLQSKTRPNALFLSVVAQFNGQIAQTVLQWFRGFNIVSGLEDAAVRPYSMESFHSGKHRREILDLVRKADLGIADLLVISEPLSKSLGQVPDELPEEFKKWLRSMPGGDHEPVSMSWMPAFIRS